MINAQAICDLLNDARRIDPAVISTLFQIRRVCRPEFRDHPHIQVWANKEEGPFWIGFIGLINGMLLAAGSADVVAVESYEKFGDVVGFSVRKYEPTQ